jgi:hypothetical protein
MILLLVLVTFLLIVVVMDILDFVLLISTATDKDILQIPCHNRQGIYGNTDKNVSIHAPFRSDVLHYIYRPIL